jgi:hypothetical protein
MLTQKVNGILSPLWKKIRKMRFPCNPVLQTRWIIDVGVRMMGRPGWALWLLRQQPTSYRVPFV